MSTVSGVALSNPAAMAFWRRHSRIRIFPGHEVEARGARALVVTFQAVAVRASLALVFTRDTLRLFRVYESSGAP